MFISRKKWDEMQLRIAELEREVNFSVFNGFHFLPAEVPLKEVVRNILGNLDLKIEYVPQTGSYSRLVSTREEKELPKTEVK